MPALRSARFALLTLALGCGSSESHPGPFEPGHSDAMTYRAAGPNGLPALRGTLLLSSPRPAGGFVEGDEFSGSWSIDWLLTADHGQPVGPQVGNGSFVAHVGAGGEVTIALHPEAADNNVDLDATMVGDDLVGTWTWTTITGPRSHGGFRVE